MEEWRTIPEWESYEASSDGRIRRVLTRGGNRLVVPNILQQQCNKAGYFWVTLSDRPARVRSYQTFVNVLVCAAFHGPRPSPTDHAAHNDGDHTNNRPANLRWATPQENSDDKEKHGTKMIGELVNGAKLTETEIRAIRAEHPRPRLNRELARKYGVTHSNISAIRRGKSWKGIGDAR